MMMISMIMVMSIWGLSASMNKFGDDNVDNDELMLSMMMVMKW